MLNQPLPNQSPTQITEAQAEAEGSSFMDFMAVHQANVS